MTKNRKKGIKESKKWGKKNNYISIMKADWFNSKFKEIREVGKIKKQVKALQNVTIIIFLKLTKLIILHNRLKSTKYLH